MIGLEKVTPVDVKSRQELRIRVGDSVRVWIRIHDKEKAWLQVFEGLVIAVKHGTEAGATFTVRRVKNGFGVEKIFPLYSPSIDRIEISQRVKTRRAKLYFLREKTSRQVRQKLSKAFAVALSTLSFSEEKKKLLLEEQERQNAVAKEKEAEMAAEKAKAEEAKAKASEEAEVAKDATVATPEETKVPNESESTVEAPKDEVEETKVPNESESTVETPKDEVIDVKKEEGEAQTAKEE